MVRNPCYDLFSYHPLLDHIRNAVHDLVPTDREGITLYPSKTANHSVSLELGKYDQC